MSASEIPSRPGKLKVMQCWDDSLTTDIPLIELLKKHHAKATFNIIPREDDPKVLKRGKQALKDTMEMIRTKFGQEQVGYVYPGGRFNDIAKQAVKEAGYLYARTTKSVEAPLPLDNPMELPSSCHWNYGGFWRRYEEAKKKGGIFYFWGHSCELGNDPVLWQKLEGIYARISADPDAEWVDVVDLFAETNNTSNKK